MIYLHIIVLVQIVHFVDTVVGVMGKRYFKTMKKHLVPEQRWDKNNRLVTRWVKPSTGGASQPPIPSPSAAAGSQIPDCPEGWIDLYHRTTPEALEAITASGTMTTRENTPEVYFSTVSEGGHGDGYGSAVVWIRVPEDSVELDDEFPDGEQHFRVPIKEITKDRMLPY